MTGDNKPHFPHPGFATILYSMTRVVVTMVHTVRVSGSREISTWTQQVSIHACARNVRIFPLLLEKFHWFYSDVKNR